MKTTVAVFLLVIGTSLSAVKTKRGYHLGGGGYQSDWRPSSNPFQTLDTSDYLSLDPTPQFDVNLPLPQASLSLSHGPNTLSHGSNALSHGSNALSHGSNVLSYGSNSLTSASNDKPVAEPQEFVPPQSVGAAVIPLLPPPATPVNAAASNVPATNRGAVFLGSGSLGVVNLGNGAYALGSGSLGYSGQRQQPRANIKVPLLSPLPASPELIPAAVPSAAPIQPVPMGIDYQLQLPQNVDLSNPLFSMAQPPQYDQNGYEYLAPNRVGFGSPSLIPRRPKVRQQFATQNVLLQQQQNQLQLLQQTQPPVQFMQQPLPVQLQTQPPAQLVQQTPPPVQYLQQSRQPVQLQLQQQGTLPPGSYDITIPYDNLR